MILTHHTREHRRMQNVDPALKRILAGLREKLPARAGYYPHDTVRDLDLYIAVAQSLLENGAVAGRYDNDAEVKKMTGLATAGGSLAEVELFGRNRMVDFTQYTPRGHYTDEALQGYFRAALWLSRLEFNIDSRSCRSSQPGDVPDPAQTPREIIDALALADLAVSAGVDGDIEIIDRAWGLFAGPREDIPLKDLARIKINAGITALHDPSAADIVIKAMADRYRRTVNTHYMPAGTAELPAICTMIGPRVTADSGAIKLLIDPEVPERHMLGAADIAYSLGNDRSARYLDGEIRKYPALGKKLADARTAAARSGGSDLFALWLAAIRDLADRPRGVVPSMMDTPAYGDLRLNSTVAAYAQIRHNYALMAAQNYDFGGCRIPDGYVEPAPKVFEALMKYAERGGSVMSAIDAGNATGARAYLSRFAGTVRVLNAIAERELENRPLSSEMKRFLSMIAEMEPGGTGGPPLYNGWYFDLFYRRADALKESYFIADYYTSAYLERIAYAGTAGLDTGIFVIDTCGAPRLAVGPVPRSFEFTGPLAKRLDDSGVAALAGKRSPWSANYTVAVKTREPALYYSCNTYSGEDRKQKITFYSPKKLNAVEIELLDHNRKRIMILTRTIGPGKTAVEYRLPKKDTAVEMIHVRYGDFDHWSAESQMGDITSSIGGCAPPSDFNY